MVPDPRSPRGKRHPLPAILTLAVCAMLSGAHSLYAIYQWGRQQEPEAISAMGFTRPATPAVGTVKGGGKVGQVGGRPSVCGCRRPGEMSA